MNGGTGALSIRRAAFMQERGGCFKSDSVVGYPRKYTIQTVIFANFLTETTFKTWRIIWEL